ncbi:MAG: OsmC family protein [Gemmatimonadales bacterium]
MSDEKNLRYAEVEWAGGLRFRGGAPGGPSVVIDADRGQQGPGPMVTLLLAAAACSGADIVSILEKMQVSLREFTIRVTGRRAPDHPRRYLTIHFAYRFRGEDLDEAKARRAIDLSHQKYCSVLQSLNPDLAVSYELDLG